MMTPSTIAAVITFAVWLLTASQSYAEVFVRDDIITSPDRARFSVCYNHSCDTVVTQSLSAAEWSGIQTLFNPPATTPEQERSSIAKAIAQMEQLVGRKTGTDRDKGKNLEGLFSDGQMDCIDESTNTTSYLRMMVSDGLIHWHSIEDRRTRYPSIISWPHTTAVIKDQQSGALYAVDSWFYENGRQPVIMPMQEWKAGWDSDNH
ncbi:MAG TPA: hypothetical protein ENI64_04930 [Gammaproteobacteria bacterium]|nr:hypothetical protein [Gammaproteobacteria bacterium]